MRDRDPKLVTAGMVLLAAAIVFEGYRWLHVIPAGRLQPPALVFAAVAALVAVLLTRAAPAAGPRSTHLLVNMAAVGLVVVTVLEVVVNRPWSTRVLGSYDLLMAAAVFGAAAVSGNFSSA